MDNINEQTLIPISPEPNNSIPDNKMSIKKPLVVSIILLAIGILLGSIILFSGNNQTNNPASNLNKIETPTPSIPMATQTGKPASPTPELTQIPQEIAPNRHVYLLEDDGTAAVNGIQFARVTNLFYQKYPDKDIYDFMAVFPAFPPGNDDGFAGLHSNIQNNVRGICEPILKADKNLWGSEKLQGIQIYPYSNSDYKEFYNPINSGHLLLEETSHQWLVYIGKSHHSLPPGQPPDGINPSCNTTELQLHNEDDLHWSFGLVMPGDYFGAIREAKPWRNKGNNTFSFDSRLEEKPRKFHPFDLYLMGFADQSEIQGDYTLLTEMDNPYASAPLPPGPEQSPVDNHLITTHARAVKITIDDIIKIAGEVRNPSVQNSQKNFTLAFIILYKKGQLPSEGLINAITTAANNFPAQWHYATDNRSTINQE